VKAIQNRIFKMNVILDFVETPAPSLTIIPGMPYNANKNMGGRQNEIGM
jgi:hypothetical protein